MKTTALFVLLVISVSSPAFAGPKLHCTFHGSGFFNADGRCTRCLEEFGAKGRETPAGQTPPGQISAGQTPAGRSVEEINRRITEELDRRNKTHKADHEAAMLKLRAQRDANFKESMDDMQRIMAGGRFAMPPEKQQEWDRPDGFSRPSIPTPSQPAWPAFTPPATPPPPAEMLRVDTRTAEPTLQPTPTVGASAFNAARLPPSQFAQPVVTPQSDWLRKSADSGRQALQRGRAALSEFADSDVARAVGQSIKQYGTDVILYSSEKYDAASQAIVTRMKGTAREIVDATLNDAVSYAIDQKLYNDTSSVDQRVTDVRRESVKLWELFDEDNMKNRSEAAGDGLIDAVGQLMERE